MLPVPQSEIFKGGALSSSQTPADSAPRTKRCRLKIVHGIVTAAAVTILGLAHAQPASAIEEAQAATGPPFNINVLVSSRSDVCYDPGDVAAIKRLTHDEQERINKRGGVSGRPIKLKFFDDARDEKRAIANVTATLADTQSIATIGLSGATRAKIVFDAMGPDILKSKIPFISDVSVNSIFSAYPNVYSTRASQDADSVPVMAQFTRQLGLARAAFVGLRDNVNSAGLGDGLRAALGELVADVRFGTESDKIIASEIAPVIAQLRDKRPDVIFLNIGGANIPVLMKELVAAAVTPALFIGGRIESLPAEITKTYPNAIYSLAWDRPPEVYNNRLRTLIAPDTAKYWVFEGQKIAAAPGWAKGECKAREISDLPDAFTSANIRAITIGSQYADMVALISAAAKTERRTTNVEELRAEVLSKLRTYYVAGHGAFKGTFDNWSFVPASRTAARDPFVIILPQSLGRTQLAPIQFIRTKDGNLRQIETLYADIDLIKAHRVSENEKTFFAEFYLSLRDNAVGSIDKIDFSNAYLDAGAGGRQVSIETIHPGGKSASYPDSMKIYRVSGRFLFNPALGNYPFDNQRFSIDLQPKGGGEPFVVQPPPLQLRDGNVIADGWSPKAQYVGYDSDFVPVVDAFTHAPSVVPFYKASFAWLMQREATDYFLRVAVPLGFILFVAYLSIFIPKSHFEAIVTIQVTALLAAVALYLSLPKLDTGAATLSDRAFVFAYMVLSLMIGISILRVSPLIGARRGPERVLQSLHIAAVPAFVGVALFYVYGLSHAGL